MTSPARSIREQPAPSTKCRMDAPREPTISECPEVHSVVLRRRVDLAVLVILAISATSQEVHSLLCSVPGRHCRMRSQSRRMCREHGALRGALLDCDRPLPNEKRSSNSNSVFVRSPSFSTVRAQRRTPRAARRKQFSHMLALPLALPLGARAAPHASRRARAKQLSRMPGTTTSDKSWKAKSRSAIEMEIYKG